MFRIGSSVIDILHADELKIALLTNGGDAFLIWFVGKVTSTLIRTRNFKN